MGTWLIAGAAWLLLAAPIARAAGVGEGILPIAARFEAPRDFGYHIGDLIPLTLVIETGPGVVVDLGRLPQPGARVDLFEVRDVRIDRARHGAGSTYRVELTVQAFIPGTVARGVAFPPLDVAFALPEDRSPDGTPRYRSLTVPAYRVFLSPTTSGHEGLRPPKGSSVPRPGRVFWGAVGVGALVLTIAALRLARELAWWRHRGRAHLAERRARRTLTAVGRRYLARDDKAPLLVRRASGVLRWFLREQCGVPAPVQTVSQIRERFRGHPLEAELTELLDRCERVTYEGHRPTLVEKEALLREVILLIGRLEEVGCPSVGGNGASR